MNWKQVLTTCIQFMREMGELLLMSFWSGGRLVSLMMQVWLSFDCQSEKRGMALTGRAIQKMGC